MNDCRCATVDLSQNAIGPSGVAAVCQAMTHNQGVQELNMSTNNLGDEGAELLASFLASEAYFFAISQAAFFCLLASCCRKNLNALPVT